MLHVMPIPAFEDNYIWLIQNSLHRQAAVVDPGDATPVLHYCQQHDITLCAILITHHHGDHTGGIANLVKHYNTPVYGPAHENIPHCNHKVNPGDQIVIDALGQLTFKVLGIPGHTSGHIAYYGNHWLFCGDTLFAGGCGRLFEGTAKQMYQSLNKLKALPPATQVFCAHEYTQANLAFALTVEKDNLELQQRIEKIAKLRQQQQPTLPSTIDIELKTNPFLRAKDCKQFAHLRKLKDQF